MFARFQVKSMTTNVSKGTIRTPTKRLLNKQRIAADNARAARWASRRRSVRNQEQLIAVHSIEVQPSIEFPVAAILPLPESLVLQDLVTRRTALLKELAELDTAIAIITRTYAREL